MINGTPAARFVVYKRYRDAVKRQEKREGSGKELNACPLFFYVPDGNFFVKNDAVAG
jgi:hypothetical protein